MMLTNDFSWHFTRIFRSVDYSGCQNLYSKITERLTFFNLYMQKMDLVGNFLMNGALKTTKFVSR